MLYEFEGDAVTGAEDVNDDDAAGINADAGRGEADDGGCTAGRKTGDGAAAGAGVWLLLLLLSLLLPPTRLSQQKRLNRSMQLFQRSSNGETPENSVLKSPPTTKSC